jgi:uncharacterized membrane protein
MNATKIYHLGASVSLIALIALCLIWELWLAPLRPGGSWLVLKTLPLLLPLFGTLRGRRYTFQWSSMFSLLYLTEGLVRASSDPGPSAVLAMIEIVLASIWFACCMLYARATRPSLNTAGRDCRHHRPQRRG